MHRMLEVLRVQDGAGAEREPQPGVRDLDRLLARTQEAGLEAGLDVRGRPRELPAGVDLSVYRIVQEALTNVIRHAGARRAHVTLAYRRDALEVTVSDDGHGPEQVARTGGGGHGLEQVARAGGGGHGLAGMRERLAMFGGELSAGQGPDGGGFRVHAVLPLKDAR
jgi:signal transduction histidine kinase